jgi:hypothetical protein
VLVGGGDGNAELLRDAPVAIALRDQAKAFQFARRQSQRGDRKFARRDDATNAFEIAKGGVS